MSSEKEVIERLRSSSYAEGIGTVAVQAIDRLSKDLLEEPDLTSLTTAEMVEAAGDLESLVTQFHTLCMIIRNNPEILETILDELEGLRNPLLLLLGDAENRKTFIDQHRPQED